MPPLSRLKHFKLFFTDFDLDIFYVKAGDPSSCISWSFCKLAVLYEPQGSLCLSSFCSTSAFPFSSLHLFPLMFLFLTHLHLLPLFWAWQKHKYIINTRGRHGFFSSFLPLIALISLPLFLSHPSSLLWCLPSDSPATLQPALARYSTRWKVCSQGSLSKIPSAASLLSMGTRLSMPGRWRERGQRDEWKEGSKGKRWKERLLETNSNRM